MKYQVLFSLKNNAEIFMNVVCCDLLFKVSMVLILAVISFVLQVQTWKKMKTLEFASRLVPI